MNSSLQTISTDAAARPFGHYSQAVMCNEIVYVSVQLGVDPAAVGARPGPIGEQARLALTNVREILEAAGSDMAHVLRVTVFVSSIEHWEAVNAAYTKAFGDHRPARGVIPCGKLHHGYDVAFEVTATLCGT